LGGDFFGKYGAHTSYGDMLYWPLGVGGPAMPMRQRMAADDEARVHTARMVGCYSHTACSASPKPPPCAHLSTIEDVMLEPYAETYVEVALHPRPQSTREYTGVLQPLTSSATLALAEKGVKTSACVLTIVPGSTTHVRVVNYSPTPVLLRRCVTLGSVSPAEEDDVTALQSATAPLMQQLVLHAAAIYSKQMGLHEAAAAARAAMQPSHDDAPRAAAASAGNAADAGSDASATPDGDAPDANLCTDEELREMLLIDGVLNPALAETAPDGRAPSFPGIQRTLAAHT
jgi:hypothetical protein